MQLFDLHTHLKGASSASIFSCTWKDHPEQVQSAYLSASIHPWYLTEENASQQLEWINQFILHPSVIALGEAGLDKSLSTSMQLQEKVFKQVIQLSEVNRLPVIIHAVRCQQELLQIKKEMHPQMPWIIHGFRGKKEMAQTYIQHGFYLSVGEHFQDKALEAIPLERLFVETDESLKNLEQNYTDIALSYGLPVEQLAQQVYQNAHAVFFTT